MINFTGGLVKVGSTYYNPDNVARIDRNEESIEVHSNDGYSHILCDGHGIENADTFIGAMLEAQKTGEVIDISV